MVNHKEASDHNLQLMKQVREEQYRTAQLTRGRRCCSTGCSVYCDAEAVTSFGGWFCVGFQDALPLGYRHHVLLFQLPLKWETQRLSSVPSLLAALAGWELACAGWRNAFPKAGLLRLL